MNLIGFSTPKNCSGQTHPASQISAHLINYTQIYALFCVFYGSGSYFWDASGERWTHGLLSKTRLTISPKHLAEQQFPRHTCHIKVIIKFLH